MIPELDQNMRIDIELLVIQVGESVQQFAANTTFSQSAAADRRGQQTRKKNRILVHCA
jgi:hypothetical protein